MLPSGHTLKVVATTLCIHSDSPGSLDIARAVAAAIAKDR
jgi:lactam utilization protein B